MKKKHTIFMTMLLWIAFFSSTSEAEQIHLRINCTVHSSYEAFFYRLVEEICTRNSISAERRTPPVGRSLISVDQGIEDGDGPRIEGLTSAYPNLIRVPESFGDFTFGAFSKSGSIKIKDWSSLSALDVAYIHGWKIFDNNVKTAASITKVRDAELLFRLLDSGRADVALITNFAGFDMIKKLGLKGIIFLKPPLAVKPTFLYLNKRHEALAPKLAQTLREIKSDGTYARIYNEIILPSLPN